MSSKPQVIVFGSQASTQSIDLALPKSVSVRQTHDWNSLEGIFDDGLRMFPGHSTSFFVLILQPLGENNDRLKKMANNRCVKGIFMCPNTNFVETSNERKLFHIDEHLMSVSITSYIIKFLRNQFEIQRDLYNEPIAKTYFKRAVSLEEWLNMTMRVQPCHILLIGLNTNHANLIAAQKCLRRMCIELGIPVPYIRLLDDYMRPRECRYTEPHPNDEFNKKNQDFICKMIQLLSPIRMYLIGNELTISDANPWNLRMVLRELDPSHEQNPTFDNRCTFIKYGPISDEIQWNFLRRNAPSWQMSNPKLLDLASVQLNDEFQGALHRADLSLETREIAGRAEINKWVEDRFKHGNILREFPAIKQVTEIDRRRDTSEPPIDEQIQP